MKRSNFKHYIWFVIDSLYYRLSFSFYRYYKANPESEVENLLAKADVKIDGNQPWDIAVHNPAFICACIGPRIIGPW